MTTRELLVKVKLESDKTNPLASPILGMGGTLPGGSSSIPGASGGANSTGGANPLAQNAQKAAESLSQFNQHINKAAESMQQLRESSKGMLSALRAVLFTGGGNSQASPGHVQTLFGGARQFLGKYGMPMAVGGGALGLAGGIMSGVNAADNFMVSRGAKPWLGHGSWDRNASGELYGWSPTRLMNQIEVGMIGGGKINSRGDIRTNDQIQGNVDFQFTERMRRTAMQAPEQALRAAHRAQMSDLDLQHGAFKSQYSSYGNYAVNAELAQDSFMSRMGSILGSSKASLQKLHGNDIGAMIAEQERFGVSQASQSYGQQIAGVKVKQDEVSSNRVRNEMELLDEMANKINIQTSQAPGDKGMVSKALEESQKRIIDLQQRGVELAKQEVQLKDQLTNLASQQAKAQKDLVTQQLSGVMQSRMQEAQTLQGQKEAFGLLDAGEQEYEKDKIQRFKSGGLDALTQDERMSLLNTPFGEDVRIASRKKADDGGWADMVRGSRAEARDTELRDRQGQLEKLQVELSKQININTQTDKTEIAKEVVTAVGRYVSELKIEVESMLALNLKSNDNQSRAAAINKSQANQ